MTDYSEHGAIPVDDAAVEHPPTVDEVIEEHDRRAAILEDEAIANNSTTTYPPDAESDTEPHETPDDSGSGST